jgi:hypothetical protein
MPSRHKSIVTIRIERSNASKGSINVALIIKIALSRRGGNLSEKLPDSVGVVCPPPDLNGEIAITPPGESKIPVVFSPENPVPYTRTVKKAEI